MSPIPERTLTLADVIDLELQVAADREANVAALRRRDAQIAAQLTTAGIDPRRTTGPHLFLPWLDQLRELEGTAQQVTAGRQTQRMLAAAGVALAFVGFALGLSVAGGWLLQAGGRPINVVFFLTAVLGAQMPLLMLWLIALVPTRWLRRVPGAESVHWLWAALAQVPPRVVGWIAARISRETGQLIGRLRGEIGRLSWIYGPLRLWLLVRLTQVFAVALNVGLLAGYVLLSYGSDPAFGWKSTLMTEAQLHQATRAIAVPWRWLPADWTDAPTLEDVQQTRYSSLDERFNKPTPDATPSGAGRWSRWWPFLIAALVCYGLLPRLVTLMISQVQVRRHLRAIRFDHSEFDRLAERLARPQIDTQATEPEGWSSAFRLPGGEQAKACTPTALSQSTGPIAALAWGGVQLPTGQLEDLLTARLGGKVEDLQPVGRLDPASDATAIAHVAQSLGTNSTGRAALVVEAWEPPVADYLDFIAELRRALGRSRPICVLLYDRGPAGRATVARASAARMWHDRLEQLGDPWLRVDSLIAGEAAS